MNTQQQALKTGELLVREGLIHEDDVMTALAVQKKRTASAVPERGKLLGMILCDLNLITPVDTYAVLHNHSKLMSLSSALVKKKMIRLEQIQALEAQSLREDIPLISLLLKTNKVSLTVMQQLLFELFHIPFRSISDFIFNPDDKELLVQIMDGQMSKENGVIPMVRKANTILFGLTAPENLLLIHQLNRHYPQYRFKAIFIPYSGFRWFHDIIYRSRPEETKGSEKTDSRSDQKKPDLSLMLSHKALITDPEKQAAAVHSFYRQYETIRTLLGFRAEKSRETEFFEFIAQAHASIVKKNTDQQIEYAFKRQGDDILIIAQPKD